MSKLFNLHLYKRFLETQSGPSGPGPDVATAGNIIIKNLFLYFTVYDFVHFISIKVEILFFFREIISIFSTN